MRKRRLSEGWRKLSESYVKRLPNIYITMLLVTSLLFFLALRSLTWPLLVVPVAGFLLVIFFHITSVSRASKKVVYPEKLLRLERWRIFVFIFSISSLFALILVLFLLPYLDFRLTDLPTRINQIVTFLLGWFLLFIMVGLSLNYQSPQTPYRMIRLCFRTTIDTLERLLAQEEAPVKDAYRRFKWLRLGFQNCNDFLIRKPYCVKMKNIDQYYQRIFVVALVGSRDELEKVTGGLRNTLKSFGNKKQEFDLPSFLTALQFILGKRVTKRKHTHVFSEMMLIRSSLLDRIKVAIRSPYTISVITIAALVVAVLTLVYQFFR